MNRFPLPQNNNAEAHGLAAGRESVGFNHLLRRLGVGIAVVGLTLGAGVALGNMAPDGSPTPKGLDGIEACAKATADPTVRAEVISAINSCALEADVTLLPSEFAQIEKAVAPALDFSVAG